MPKTEYMERVALIKFVKKNIPNIHGDTTVKAVERVLKAAPFTVDVAEVVRCEKCIYSDEVAYVDGKTSRYCRLRSGKFVNSYDFCSWGVRRDDSNG